MMSAIPTPSNPRCRNIRPATWTTLARFFSACSRLTRIRQLLDALIYDSQHPKVNIDDGHHPLSNAQYERAAPSGRPFKGLVWKAPQLAGSSASSFVAFFFFDVSAMYLKVSSSFFVSMSIFT